MGELLNRIGKIIFLICTLFFIGSFLFFAYVMWGDEILHPDDPFGDMNEDILEEANYEEQYFAVDKKEFTSATLMGITLVESEKEGYYYLNVGILAEDAENETYIVHFGYEIPETWFNINFDTEDYLYTLVDNSVHQQEMTVYGVQRVEDYDALQSATAKFVSEKYKEYALKEFFLYDAKIEELNWERNWIVLNVYINARYEKNVDEKDTDEIFCKYEGTITFYLTEEEMEEFRDVSKRRELLNLFVEFYEDPEQDKCYARLTDAYENVSYKDRNILDFDDIEKKGFWFFK